MSAFVVAAFVERGHWFVGRSRLQLHEIGARVVTRRAPFVSRVNILPCFFTAEQRVDTLHRRR